MKRRLIACILVFALISGFSCATDQGEVSKSFSKREIRAVIEFLSHDLLEGRAPGTRGGELAENYVKSVFEILGIDPYRGDYFQEFELRGYTLNELSARVGGMNLSNMDDLVGTYVRNRKEFSLSGEVVFAGFGITCSAWNWDDYGDSPVKDKIVIVRVNEPGRNNPDLFEGQALTYYGRWTYKIEEAARRGAKGILLIHTDDSAGYGWHVVQNSWGGEELYLPSMLENNLEFRGWIREEKLREILAARNISLEELYGKSERRDFLPVQLGLFAEVSGSCSFRSFKTRNVVGYIEGADPELLKKAVVLSAHIDHLGKNDSLEGDRIFNGAIDNGSAAASMIAAAGALAKHRESLEYSVILLACQAEEAGLLGSRYFAESVKPDRIVADINFESTPVWEAARDFMAIGAKYSTLEEIIKDILKRRKLGYTYFSMSNQGFFYRSDQFSFARRGIPSVWVSAGEDYVSGRNRIREFFLGDYHTVDDEFDPGWELESTAQTVEVALDLVEYLNERKPEIPWKGRMTFPVEK
jgi:hypothetical protein